MRRLMFLMIAVSFLGTMVGCNTCGSRGCGLGLGSSSCDTSGCSTGRCGGGRSHSHGVCDCETDDYCSSRSPWIRHGAMVPAPMSEAIPAPPAKVMPEGKMKL